MTFAIDPDDLQDGPITGPEPLRDLIVSQARLQTGIFVLLFTSETVAPIVTGADPGADHEVDLVAEQASGLGIDLDELALFSDDAYLLQSTLGAVVVAESA